MTLIWNELKAELDSSANKPKIIICHRDDFVSLLSLAEDQGVIVEQENPGKAKLYNMLNGHLAYWATVYKDPNDLVKGNKLLVIDDSFTLPNSR